MAQGFKAKPPAKKQRSSASVSKQVGKTKKGARTIPPKKKELVDEVKRKKAVSSEHGQHFEEVAAAKAANKGKLSEIMKVSASRGDSTAKR